MDDILLLAPSLQALRCMLNICSAFASVNNIHFNPVKSLRIRFSRHTSRVEQFLVELQSVTLTWIDQILHLSRVLYSNLDPSDINARHRDFCSQANYFFARFNHVIPVLKCHLFLTYCQSFSGSQIWNLQNATLNAFELSWRKAVATVGLAVSHSPSLSPHLMSGNNFVSILASRSFANSCFSSFNNKISFIARNTYISPQHHFCSNVYFVHNLFYNQHNLFHPAGNVLCELLFV